MQQLCTRWWFWIPIDLTPTSEPWQRCITQVEKLIVILKYPANRKINGCSSMCAFCPETHRTFTGRSPNVHRTFVTHSALGHRFFDIPLCIFSLSLTAYGLDNKGFSTFTICPAGPKNFKGFFKTAKCRENIQNFIDVSTWMWFPVVELSRTCH